MGNPALFPLIYSCQSRDILIVRVNPFDKCTQPLHCSGYLALGLFDLPWQQPPHHRCRTLRTGTLAQRPVVDGVGVDAGVGRPDEWAAADAYAAQCGRSRQW